MLETLTFGFLGGGNMATALIGGLIARGVPAGSIRVVDPFPDAQQRLARDLGVHTAGAPDAAFGASDVLVLAVKPQQFREAAASLLPHLPATGAGNLIISVAAGIRLQDMQRWLGGRTRLVRAMPNTPALSGMGMTGLAGPAGLSSQDRAMLPQWLKPWASAHGSMAMTRSTLSRPFPAAARRMCSISSRRWNAPRRNSA